MRSVDLKALRNTLSKYVRLAANGETILVTERGRVVAELGPPRTGRSALLRDAFFAKGVREGWLTPAKTTGGPLPRKPVMSFDELMRGLERDREDR